MFITTLPVTPKRHVKATTLTSPLVSHALSLYFGAQQIISLNLHGQRFAHASIEDVIDLRDWYCLQLDRNGVCTNLVIDEYNNDFRNWFDKTIVFLRSFGALEWREHEMLMCECGNVDVPVAHVYNLYGQGKALAFSDSGHLWCRYCKSSIKKAHELRLEWILKASVCQMGIYPSRYSAEVMNRLSFWQHKGGVIVSKSRIKNIHNIRLDSLGNCEQVFDPEFVWSLYLSYIAQKIKDFDVILTVSSRVIHHACRVLLMTSQICSHMTVKLVITPIVNINSFGNVDFANLGLEQFTSMSTAMARRAFLLSGLSWNTKEAQTSSRMMRLAEQSFGFMPNVKQDNKVLIGNVSIDRFGDMCSATKINSLLASLRRNRLLSNDQRMLYRILTLR